MLSQEAIDQDHEVRPEWLRIPEAIKRFGMSRTKLYELISEGDIRSVSLRKRGQIRGTRLISYDSMCDYLNELADQQKR
ncbi:MAG: helix-turn-helix domain-containing protein [Verrucomicrobiae bacterium]|nr:helix-turn-helix domain-containing protein [Verrucomicrobiae bacterium]